MHNDSVAQNKFDGYANFHEIYAWETLVSIEAAAAPPSTAADSTLWHYYTLLSSPRSGHRQQAARLWRTHRGNVALY